MVRTENLFFTYTGSPPYILDDINLEIRKGEYVSVVGENGSGKTTLMRLILKLILPTNGRILSDAKKVGYVAQKHDFSGSNFPITVYEVLSSYRRLLRIKDQGVIMKALEQVGMSAYANALMGTLSGGQGQKILIARALMGNPDLLILDEPSSGVDIESQKEIYSLIKETNRENGITVISVEHNLDAAVANSTLIYHLTEGSGHLCSLRQYADEFLKNREG